MRVKMFLLPVLSVLLLGADAPKEDAQQIQGTWKVVSAEDSGRKAPQDSIKDLRWTITRDAITYQVANRTTRWSYKLDPAKKPKWVDLTEDGRIRVAIYDLNGDTLKVCFAEGFQKERPTAFESKANSPNDVLIVLKREKRESR